MARPRMLRWAPAFVALAVLGGCGAPAIKASTRGGGTDPSTTSASKAATASTSTTSTTASTTTTTTTTTTITQPVPVPLAPTVPAAASSRWHVEGQHSGTEHFVLYSGRCAFLDHHLQETFTLADGRTWSFEARYCGTIDAHNVWSGAGSFSLATAPGSELTGTFADSAQLPSTGVPYVLDVHAGTGDFVGAHGKCVLENHLRTISFGVQEQFGTFVCDLTG